MCLLHFGTPKLPFGSPLGSLGVSFSACWRGLWSFLGILWVQNGARNIKMRVIKAILAQVEVARGSQRLSMDRFWEDVHHIFSAIWYCGILFGEKGFVHHGCSVALQLLFSMCWTWSRQRRRRGRRPHDVHVRCLEVHGAMLSPFR